MHISIGIEYEKTLNKIERDQNITEEGESVMKIIQDLINEILLTCDLEKNTKPNGYELNSKRFEKFNTMFEFYNPLDNFQIDFLEQDVNNAQGSNFVFPEFLKSLLSYTNGMNLFYGSLSFYGSQTH